MGVVPFDAGQVRHSVVAAHDENEAEHDADAEVDPLVCHGGYHFPGILAGIVSLHAADTAERTRSSGCSCSFNFFLISRFILRRQTSRAYHRWQQNLKKTEKLKAPISPI